jgi:catechol 2,3-dioxygenase-like lactoylglutathione lyase family enzyme
MMSRVQLALNVSNLDEAIEFYSKMFNAKPAKVREGYANFAIAEPPLKLVLIERAADDTSEFHHLNHLGVELEDSVQVDQSIERFENLGLVAKIEKDTVCCYAKQDKVWVQSPDDAPWEFYTVLADSPTFFVKVDGVEGSACCS